MQETILVDDLGGGGGVLVVAFHDVEASAAHLALHTDGAFLARLWIEDLHFHEGEVAAHSGATLFKGVVEAGLRHAR